MGTAITPLRRSLILTALLSSLPPSIVHASPILLRSASVQAENLKYSVASATSVWWKLGISICLVLAGGVFAGLTLGLMGLDELHLRVLAMSSDDPLERSNAQTVLNLMNKGRHWVLVSLLLSNVVMNESLPIFLDSVIGGGIAAVVLSTTMIVIFGVIPQAACARYGLTVGAHCASFVLCLMYILAPVAWPIAKILDCTLGASESHTYKKAELKYFLQAHRQGEEPLKDEEITILNGVLELNTKRAVDIMTEVKDVVTISSDTIMDYEVIGRLLASGYSRFPVHEPGKPMNFIGLLLIKTLLRYDPSEKKPVSSFKLSILPEALPTINCFQALDYFRIGRAHLLLISDTPGKEGGALGIVTLEDVIEEIITEEIVDETDLYESNRQKRRAKRRSNADIMRGIVERARQRAGTVSTVGESPLRSRSGTVSTMYEQSPLLTKFSGGRPTSLSLTDDGIIKYGAVVSQSRTWHGDSEEARGGYPGNR